MTYLSAYDTRLDTGGDSSGGSRRGGEDPCCPPGYDPAGIWPRNAGILGAPPDYRTPGSPMEDPSPSGNGRLKDDFCDCIAIEVGGRYWKLGVVHGGRVELGPLDPADLEDAVWVEVTRAGAVVSVPGTPLGGDDVTTTGGGCPSGYFQLNDGSCVPAGPGGHTDDPEEPPTWGGGGTEDDGSAGPGQCGVNEEWVEGVGCMPGPTDGAGDGGGTAGGQVPTGTTGGGSGPWRTDPVVDTEAGHGVLGYLLGFVLAAALTSRGG